MKKRIIFVIIFALMTLLIYSFSVVSARPLVNDQKQSPSSANQPIGDQDNNPAIANKMFSSLKEAFDSNKEQLKSIVENGTKTIPVPVPKQSEKSSELNIGFVHISSEWSWTFHQIAIIEHDNYIIGDSNGFTAHMHVSGDDAEAFIVGHLSRTCDGGTVSVTCCLGPDQPCSTNILIFYVSNDGYNWTPIINPPHITVTWSSLAEYYAASFSQYFSYVGVCTWSPSTQYNSCLSVDSITVTTSGEPSSNVLTIATTDGGTTNPSPGGYYYYGETAAVTAIPNLYYYFDYWDIDGNYESTDNPLYIQTWDGDHYITTHFTYDPDQQWIVIAYSGGGYTDPWAGTYVGCGTMSITEYPSEGYGFSYWLVNGNYYSSDQTIYVDYGASTVEPVFCNLNPPITHQLNVNAVNIYNEVQLYPSIYIDGNYVGSGTATIQVTEGYHYVEIDSWYSCYYLVGYSENWNSPVYSDTEMAAFYDLGGK